MPSSSKRPAHSFRLRARGPEELVARVFDAHDRVVLEACGGTVATALLPRGWYFVTTELGALTKEDLVRHDGDREHEAGEPTVPSAAPLQTSSLARASIQEAAVEWSQRETRPPLGPRGAGHAYLFVFVQVGDDDPNKSAGRQLSLFDGHGRVLVADFDEPNALRGPEGWCALSASAPPGRYHLYTPHVHPSRRRSLGIDLYDGWSTHVFVVDKAGPCLEDATILLRRLGRPFNPHDVELNKAARALGALQNRERIPLAIISDLLAGKFDDPILGLAGVHVLLRQDPAANVATVLMRLRELLGECADVDALDIASATGQGRAPQAFGDRSPPMLRAGCDALLRAVDRHPHVLPSRSRVEDVAMRQRRGSPWTVWEGPPFSTEPFSSGMLKVAPPARQSLVSENRREQRVLPAVVPWLAAAIEDAGGAKALSHENIAALARAVGLPTRTVGWARDLLLSGGAADSHLRSHLTDESHFVEMLVRSASMFEVFRAVQMFAATELSVLITGETGTGKELIAREIHRRSKRASGPFVVFDCGAIPETLVESALFGHGKSAFTGAVASRPGKLQVASGGTLLLDEIGELPLNAQASLLRALHERAVVRVGDSKPEQIDVRIVSATSKNLHKEINERRFREDLYYRLSGVNIHVPPLRERGDDVVIIAQYLLSKIARELESSRVQGFKPETVRAIRKNPWFGNIRQLEHNIRRALISADHSLLSPDDLGLDKNPEVPSVDEIRAALAREQGNVTRAAAALGLSSRHVLYRLMRKLDIDEGDEP